MCLPCCCSMCGMSSLISMSPYLPVSESYSKERCQSVGATSPFGQRLRSVRCSSGSGTPGRMNRPIVGGSSPEPIMLSRTLQTRISPSSSTYLLPSWQITVQTEHEPQGQPSRIRSERQAMEMLKNTKRLEMLRPLVLMVTLPKLKMVLTLVQKRKENTTK